MKTIILAGFLLFGGCLEGAEPPAGFTSIFNGQDLAGWRGGTTYDHRELLALPEAARRALIANWTSNLSVINPATGKPHWYAENDELVNDGFGSYATTVKDYGDIELLADYKMKPQADSGIYLRGVPQVQIWDHAQADPRDYGRARGSGGLWNNRKGSPGRDPLVMADKPTGEWNHIHLIMVGSRVTVWLNGKLVVDHAILENFYDRNLPPSQRRSIPLRGPIELQSHGGEIRWRNLFLREIGSDEACQILARHDRAGFHSIFNGKNFDGWAGPLEAVKVKAGVIVWQLGGGTIYWDKILSDFQARVEFKLPPGGNNGLAIRYPGTGIPAFDGMCECQVLDDNYEKVKGKIDPRQAHGSAYAMVAAVRGYQHPIGEWNFEEVTVKGSTIKVELNGTVILDADLSRVKPSDFMGRHLHPGKDRTNGFFGFVGHDDPVEFRQVFIKEL